MPRPLSKSLEHLAYAASTGRRERERERRRPLGGDDGVSWWCAVCEDSNRLADCLSECGTCGRPANAAQLDAASGAAARRALDERRRGAESAHGRLSFADGVPQWQPADPSAAPRPLNRRFKFTDRPPPSEPPPAEPSSLHLVKVGELGRPASFSRPSLYYAYASYYHHV